MGKEPSAIETVLNHLDLKTSENYASLGEDLAIIRNPSFRFEKKYPYKSPFMVAIFCKEGHASGNVNLHPYHIGRGSFLIVLPNHIMEATAVSDDFVGTYIMMSTRFLTQLQVDNEFAFQQEIANAPFIQFDQQGADAINLYCDMCSKLISITSNPHREEALLLLTKAFFLGMGYFIHHREPSTTKDSPNRQMLVNRFLSLVEANYREHRDLQYYADLMCLSPKYISTMVKQLTDRTAGEWIERYVILDAQAQLATSKLTIQQISDSLHFENQSLFGRYFKRSVGMSPKHYRAATKLSL